MSCLGFFKSKNLQTTHTYFFFTFLNFLLLIAPNMSYLPKQNSFTPSQSTSGIPSRKLSQIFFICLQFLFKIIFRYHQNNVKIFGTPIKQYEVKIITYVVQGIKIGQFLAPTKLKLLQNSKGQAICIQRNYLITCSTYGCEGGGMRR